MVLSMILHTGIIFRT